MVYEGVDPAGVRLFRHAERIGQRLPGDPLSGKPGDESHRSARTPPWTQIGSERTATDGSHGLLASHAELDELGVEATTVAAADANIGRALGALAGRVPHVPRAGHDADQEEDPPKAYKPAADSGEDASNHEEHDRAEERLEECHHGEGRTRRLTDGPHEEIEEPVEDQQDANDQEGGSDQDDSHGAPRSEEH